MELTPTRSWKAEFARSTQSERYREIMRRAIEESRRQEREDERSKDADEVEEAVAVIASEAALAEFTAELDAYDTATVEALTANQEAIEATRQDIQQMLARAEVLPDGRRVFKTNDGLRVFDEFGHEITDDLVDPEQIDDAKPKWEAFQSLNSDFDALSEQRQQLLDYQQKLDDARDRVRAGNVTENELADMRKDLTADMPASVQTLLPDELKPDVEDAPKDEASLAGAEPSAKPILQMPTL